MKRFLELGICFLSGGLVAHWVPNPFYGWPLCILLGIVCQFGFIKLREYENGKKTGMD